MELTVLLHRLGWLDAETAMQVLVQRVDRRPPLGALAAQRGLLTQAEVVRVLTAQAADRCGLRFGEMAVTMGLLSVEELGWLLREQTRCVPSEFELAVELGGLDRAELEHSLAVHRAHQRAEAVPADVARCA